jgi:hypothetical protein
MVCPPATSEAGARWPRFVLVVVATTTRRNNKVQMIRPYVGLSGATSALVRVKRGQAGLIWSRRG